jgi:hypothetical protein
MRINAAKVAETVIQTPGCHEVRVLPGALTLRERDVVCRLVPGSSASRGRILWRSPPGRPIEADVLVHAEVHDPEEGDER